MMFLVTRRTRQGALNHSTENGTTFTDLPAQAVPLGKRVTTTAAIRPYRNFAPFVRQTGEGKAQTCAKAIFQQLCRNRTVIAALGAALSAASG
jgi:hypothetical protein